MVFWIGGRLREMVAHEDLSIVYSIFIQDVQSSRKCRVGKR